MAEPGSGKPDVVGLLEQQRVVYRQLRDLTDRQRALIDRDDAQGLLGLLSERQRLVERLGRLGQELLPLRERWAEVMAALPAEQQRAARGMLKEVDELLREILEADRRDTAALSARREAIGRELTRTAAGRRANDAYVSPSAGQSRYLDKTDDEG